MANILAAATGNWSAGATWTGGVAPGAGDVAVANGKTVTIDQDITCVALDNTTTGGATAGGWFAISDTGGGTRTITLSEGLGKTTATERIGAAGALLRITATSGTVGIVGACKGGAGSQRVALLVSGVGVAVTILGSVSGGTSGGECYGIHVTAISTVTITGNVLNPGGSWSWYFKAIYVQAAATITVNGDVTGLSGQGDAYCYAIDLLSGASLVVNGNVTGGSYGNIAQGVNIGAACSCTINGNVTSGVSSAAVVCASDSAVLDINGSVYPSAVTAGNTLALVRIAGTVYSSSNGLLGISARRIVTRANSVVTFALYQADNWPYITGTVVPLSNALSGVPATANVRQGTIFGGGNSLTGTLAVPLPSQVAAGIATDNTVGTAAIALADVAAVVGAQIASAVGA